MIVVRLLGRDDTVGCPVQYLAAIGRIRQTALQKIRLTAIHKIWQTALLLCKA